MSKAQTRYGKLAPDLPKQRKTKDCNHAAVIEYNERQLMRCVETRARPSSGNGAPVGLRHATLVATFEAARKHLPSWQAAAYLAREHDSQDAANALVSYIEPIVVAASINEAWVYVDTPLRPKTRLMASIIVEEWLHSDRFWKPTANGGEKPNRAAFARVMGCDPKTWRDTWHHRFELLRGYPEDWYREGRYMVHNNV